MDSFAAVSGARAVAADRKGFLALLRLSLSAHGIYLAIVAAYFASFLILARLHPDMQPSGFLMVALGFIALSVPIMFFGILITRLYHIAVHVKPDRALPVLLKDVWKYLSDPGRLAHGLPMVFIIPTFMYVFVELKSNIALLHPYSWDVAFAHWDQVLHFGRQPWQWLQPVTGHAPVTFFININYAGWFVVMCVVWVYFAFLDTASEIRTRFFFTFFAIWIIGGSIMAIYFSSVGPCFYGRFGLSPDPYAGLLTYLRQSAEVLPNFAVNIQDFLWTGYTGGGSAEGISAMPSVHNGTALLFALATFQVSRKIGWLLVAFAGIIFIGSVSLAWHYAVDCYVAWALTYVVWRVSAPVARWWHGRKEHLDFAAALERRANGNSGGGPA